MKQEIADFGKIQIKPEFLEILKGQLKLKFKKRGSTRIYPTQYVEK
jgi:hypothetical protein